MSGTPLIELFYDHVGPSMARHLALLQAVEGLPCHIDLKRGEVRFGDRFLFHAQLLGIEDLDAGTWRWSWALPRGVVAPAMTERARSLETWGKENGYEAFYAPSFKTDRIRGDELAILARGVTDSDTFLVAETELGMAYLLIPDVEGQVPLRISAALLAKVIPKVLTSYRLDDHRRVVSSLLRFAGYDVGPASAETLQASRPSDGSRVTVRFDRQGRVSGIDAAA